MLEQGNNHSQPKSSIQHRLLRAMPASAAILSLTIQQLVCTIQLTHETKGDNDGATMWYYRFQRFPWELFGDNIDIEWAVNNCSAVVENAFEPGGCRPMFHCVLNHMDKYANMDLSSGASTLGFVRSTVPSFALVVSSEKAARPCRAQYQAFETAVFLAGASCAAAEQDID